MQMQKVTLSWTADLVSMGRDEVVDLNGLLLGFVGQGYGLQVTRSGWEEILKTSQLVR